MVSSQQTTDCLTIYYQPERASLVVVGLTVLGACMLPNVLIGAALETSALRLVAQILACVLVLLGFVWVFRREYAVNTAKTARFARAGSVRIEEERNDTGQVVTELPYSEINEIRLHCQESKGVRTEVLMLKCRHRATILLAQAVGPISSDNQLWLLANDLRNWTGLPVSERGW